VELCLVGVLDGVLSRGEWILDGVWSEMQLSWISCDVVGRVRLIGVELALVRLSWVELYWLVLNCECGLGTGPRCSSLRLRFISPRRWP
jgi:hypothetical protein